MGGKGEGKDRKKAKGEKRKCPPTPPSKDFGDSELSSEEAHPPSPGFPSFVCTDDSMGLSPRERAYLHGLERISSVTQRRMMCTTVAMKAARSARMATMVVKAMVAVAVAKEAAAVAKAATAAGATTAMEVMVAKAKGSSGDGNAGGEAPPA